MASSWRTGKSPWSRDNGAAGGGGGRGSGMARACSGSCPTRCRPRPGGAGGASGTDRVSLFPFQVQVKLVSPWGSRPQSHHEGKASLNQLEWLSNSGSVGAVVVAGLRVLQRQVCGVARCGAFPGDRGSAGANIHGLWRGVELWSQFGAISPKAVWLPNRTAPFAWKHTNKLPELERLKS